ncbi:MAG: WbqC family protein [Planctomycetaceae bacterium]|nr:WbqC family protein [Planctomycetaceae bacterium]
MNESDRTMRLGVMQPYFFPYLGYFQLMAAVDQWVVFDTSQYTRRTWINRNRILANGGDPWKYVRIPVARHVRTSPISEIRIAGHADWKSDLLNDLDYYQIRHAPFRSETLDFLNHAIDSSSDRLVEILVHSLKITCQVLGIEHHQFLLASEIGVRGMQVQHSGQWALEVSRLLGAAEYVNPAGGRDLFVPSEFSGAGIKLKFLEPQLDEYQQQTNCFVPGLSILDALMWLGIAEVRRLVSGGQIVDASISGDSTPTGPHPQHRDSLSAQGISKAV